MIAFSLFFKRKSLRPAIQAAPPGPVNAPKTALGQLPCPIAKPAPARSGRRRAARDDTVDAGSYS